MPIYEYQCDACMHKFEQIQKISDPLLEVCPECKEKALRKLVSAAGFRLKGTGWYVTDFKDKKPANNKGDSGKASEGKKASDTGGKPSTTASDSSASSTKSGGTGSSGSSSD